MRKALYLRTPLAAALLASTVLGGCVVAQYRQAKFADGSLDECHLYRQPLISAKETIERNTALAAVGAGLLGFLTAKAAGANNAQAAAAGLAAGAAGGFFANQASQGKASVERQKLLAELQGSANAASRTPGTISRMTECRRNQVAQVKKSTDAGLLSSAVARQKLLQIQEQTRLDNQLVGDFVADARGKVGEYVQLAGKDNISEEQLLGQYNDPDLPWLRDSYAPSATAAPAGTVSQRVSANGARVRASANTNSAVLGSVSSGETVYVVPGGDQGSWKEVVYKGRPAYIHGSLLGDGASASSPPPPASAPDVRVEGENEQQVAVRELSRSTLEAEAQQKELQAVDTEIDGLLAALKA